MDVVAEKRINCYSSLLKLITIIMKTLAVSRQLIGVFGKQLVKAEN